jgi:hypothetical protein
LKKPDKLSFGVGVAVALLLTSCAYYSNSHPGAARISELAYLVFFPPSIGLMATENASRPEQIVIVLFLAMANGALYWLASFICRRLVGSRDRPSR